MGSCGRGLMLACCLLLAFACGPVLSRVPRGQQEQQEQEGTLEPPPPLDDAESSRGPARRATSPSMVQCRKLPRGGSMALPASSPLTPDPSAVRLETESPVAAALGKSKDQVEPCEKGDRGDRGLQGKYGKTGSVGARGHSGPKGEKGSMGAPGDRCKNHYAAFSVGRKKPLHSNDYYQTVIFDTEFVNLYSHFNMFTGKFYCYVPGIYFFSLNVHTWNQKETYLHIMKNGEEAVILYAQVSDRSIMQSQSLMLELREQDEVWVRLFKGERENAIFSDEFDTYITFSGYLVKHAAEP
ncbi:PREDICTED: complement C1q tumor necrosis factor-related protein 1 [Galeopterus variegatus]|uniref:Complement C1q tumor necrosis factor-related protein 1 n=1 Tax=Galeopterus variegatus TaxID=482537 RepID=A0ABM0R197_GALVR|nr:PREDICTED: complement C1q tumor necrosis factor-related protein 1 [Galeopterus variegatus]